MAVSCPFFAVDIGNSRIKIGRFETEGSCSQPRGEDLSGAGTALPLPDSIIQLPVFTAQDRSTSSGRLRAWLAGLPEASASDWVVATVNRSHVSWLRETIIPMPTSRFHVLQHGDLPLQIRVDLPERVGMDRLLGAVAADRLRDPGRPAIVIDIGTAITVDLVSAEGAFEGGAILPGIAMAARALESQTEALPCSPLTELVEPPPPVGKSTIAAIESGLLWGTVGALRELIGRIEKMHDCPPQVFVTGGTSTAVVPLLQSSRVPVVHVPELVLAGIAITAQGEPPCSTP